MNSNEPISRSRKLSKDGSSTATTVSDKLHKSHKTRISMGASSYDEICTVCSRTDSTNGGWGALALPCPGKDK